MSLPALQLLFVKASSLLSRKGSKGQTPIIGARQSPNISRLLKVLRTPDRTGRNNRRQIATKNALFRAVA